MSNEARFRASRALIVVGILGLVWATLHLSSNALGGPPEELGFAHRRPYNQVKTEVHASFLGMLWRAGLGGVLIWLGTRLSPSRDEAA